MIIKMITIYLKMKKKYQQVIQKMMNLSIIQKICLWDGMVNQFRIGCINYMDWALNINAKFVVITAIGAEELLKDIFRNGDMLMV